MIIIAIDGFSSSGKSTMAKRLAAKIGYRYIDTGAMYRAVALWAMRHGIVSGGKIDEKALADALPDIAIDFKPLPDGTQHTLLNGVDVESDIRGIEVSNQVSTIAAIPFVRRALVRAQQAFGQSKGIVMDGRDIGTVVFPQAELKIFVNASPETRAMRRYKELQAKGQEVTYDEVLANVQHRDLLDSTREDSPLRQADDAILLDNSLMTPDQQDEWLIQKFHETEAKYDC